MPCSRAAAFVCRQFINIDWRVLLDELPDTLCLLIWHHDREHRLWSDRLLVEFTFGRRYRHAECFLYPIPESHVGIFAGSSYRGVGATLEILLQSDTIAIHTDVEQFLVDLARLFGFAEDCKDMAHASA